jgi:alkyl hydroperoxide reductase subunit AhpC
MMKYLLATSLLFTGMLYAQDFKLGSKVDNFEVQALDGKSMSFADLRGPVTVVTFISVQCPVSNAYNERMNAIYQDYGAKGVKFIFVNANRTESASDVAAHAKSVGFAFPVYKDPNNVLADRFDAQVTPESYVIDSQGIVRYHGSIDDQQTESRVRQRRLRAALDQVLAGQEVQAKETKAFGCTIKRVRKAT